MSPVSPPPPRREPLVAAPLRKQVIDLLRGAITSLEYRPGQRLVERDLCERFDVSRTVIREALRHLEAEGLVDLVANRGPVVSSVSPTDARALYEVREALESLASRCCAERATPAQRRALARSLSRVGTADRRADLAGQLAARDEFYEVLTEGAGNPVTASLLRMIRARVQVLRGLSPPSVGRRQESLAELRTVVAAIERGDAEAAARLAAAHVRNAGQFALALMSEGPAQAGPVTT
jgi:DNA-binding GntR family transcriptional regulator